jgi:uncharacterized protein YlbG (UPF0298 family)
MKIDRKGFVVYFNKREAFMSRVKQLDINIIYTSKKSNYFVFYCDAIKEKDIKYKISRFDGFLSLEDSKIINKEVFDFDEEGY